jgi:hypothetical protein
MFLFLIEKHDCDNYRRGDNISCNSATNKYILRIIKQGKYIDIGLTK